MLWIKQTVTTTTRKCSRTPVKLQEYDSSKRSRTSAEPESSTSSGQSNYNKHIEKMTAVDRICDKLSAKHGDKYTHKQYRCWANLIQLHKHDSYDSPPNKHFFSTEKSKSTVAAVGVRISPSKRINVRSECTMYVDKWHGLKDL